jgi:hypothetical protein
MSTSIVAQHSSMSSTAWPFYFGAAADIAVGVALLLFSGPIAAVMMPDQSIISGFAAASILKFLGAFLIVFAIETIIVARPGGRFARFRSWIVAANWATVVLAGVVLVIGHSLFSALGVGLVAAIAVALTVVAYLQRQSL